MASSKQLSFNSITNNFILLCCIFSMTCKETLTTGLNEIGCDELMSEFEDEKSSCDVHETKFYKLLQTSRDHSLYTDSKTNRNVFMQKILSLMTKLREIKLCSCTRTFCDCSSLNLTEIPRHLPQNMTMLSLSNNSISVLPNCSFCVYDQLTYLDLSSNSLTRLEVGSFWKLKKLEYLSLKNNSLVYVNTTFPQGVFSDLQNVTCLKINRNTNTNQSSIHQYPDEFLSDFVQLETLYLDGIEFLYFDKSFSKLRKLKTLILAGGNEGYCKIISLKGETFRNVAQITHLNISDCQIAGDRVNTSVFVPLVNLTSLDVSYNIDFSLSIFLKSLEAVLTYNITKLIMNAINDRFSPSVTITQSMIQSLPATLIYLEAKRNNLESIQRGILQEMPPKIKYIDVGGNLFLFKSYIQDIHLLTNLEVLKINSDSNINIIPKYQPFVPVLNSFQTRQKRYKDELFQITLPPKLLYLEMRNMGLQYVISELNFNESNILQSLNLMGNCFPILVGPLNGLKKLEKLDLSYCEIKDIYDNFFQDFENLKELNLKSNKIGESLLVKKRDRIFQNMTQLKVINLSENDLSKFGTNVFQKLDNLAQIDFSFSEIRGFIINILNMYNLTILNVSHAELNFLPLYTRQHIDFLLTKHTVIVDLSSNPIFCDCSNLDFLKWMVNSRAFDPKFRYYMCQYEDSSYMFIDDSYQETIRYLSIKCADNSVIFLVVVSATLCMVAFVAVAVLYRFRWKIRYLYHAAYLIFKSKRKVDFKEDNFRFDVFVSYTYQDEEFIVEQILPELTKRDLKVLVHGRDFAVGEFIASNIVTAVKESRKTLVVLTRDLLRSTWCHFELQMANMESVHTGRSVLVFLIKETIPTKEMNSDLLKHVNNNTYIVYPQEETTPVFWDKLTKDLLLP